MQTLDTDLARRVAEQGDPERSSAAGDRAVRDQQLDRIARLEYAATVADPAAEGPDRRRGDLQARAAEVSQDLCLILSLLVASAAADHLLAPDRLVLGFYAVPTVVVAYLRGRHRAILTTAAATLMVGFVAQIAPEIWRGQPMGIDNLRLVDMITWGLTMILITYTLGTLRDRWSRQRAELQAGRQGLLAILGQFLDEDRDVGRHSHRVALHAVTIAEQMDLPRDQVDLIETAARLHDLGKLDTSRSVLEKASELSCQEREHVQDHAHRGMEMLQPVAATLGRVLPIILAHHDRYDGGGYRPVHADEIPLEARVIAVADVYDALISDRPYRRALPPFEARQTIERGAGTEFDPAVVAAFRRAYDLGLLEVPAVYG